MSVLFQHRTIAFLKHDDNEKLDVKNVNTAGGGSRLSEPALREDHIVLLAIDAVLALHAITKRYFERRRTRRILAELDDRQLRDVGLTRTEALRMDE